MIPPQCNASGKRPARQRATSLLGAVSLLSVARWSVQQPLHELIDSRQPIELQLAVIRALGSSDQKEVVPLRLANWTGLVPRVQESVVDALFARQDRLPLLLDAVQHGTVPAVSLSSLRREQLLEHGNQAIRERARRLLVGRSSDDRAAAVERYAAALTLPRDPARGCHRALNATVIAITCHRQELPAANSARDWLHSIRPMTPRSIQNGCISFCPQWLVFSAR